jgi:NAD(P)-dependent dehydrogenase (short-subunit alcohol dehydrogenase family)
MWAKTAVVTGATAGVGRAVSRMLAQQGVNVGLLARGSDGLKATETELTEMGVQALGIPTDVADHHQVKQATATIEAELGPIDLWINNAMVTVMGPTWDVTEEEFRRVTEVVYLGVVNGTKAALDHMMPRDRGRIVQVGSALSQRGIPLQGAYCASKHAVKGFTESLRAELLHAGSAIDVSIVQLPAMNTPQFLWGRSHLDEKAQPVPPIYQPEVGARAVMLAAETGRPRIWAAFPTVYTILGEKAAAGMLDHYLAGNGFDAQTTGEPLEPDHQDNLFTPVEGDFGAHGPFDDRAKERSWQLWADSNRGPLALGALAVAGLVGLASRH